PPKMTNASCAAIGWAVRAPGRSLHGQPLPRGSARRQGSDGAGPGAGLILLDVLVSQVERRPGGLSVRIVGEDALHGRVKARSIAFPQAELQDLVGPAAQGRLARHPECKVLVERVSERVTGPYLMLEPLGVR